MFLDGITVMEVSCGVAGSWAGATLRDLGATVGRLPCGTRAESTFQAWLNRDKEELDFHSVRAALTATGPPDVIVCDRVEGVGCDLPADLADYLSFVAGVNPSVWVTISAYGLSGSRAGRFGSDFVVSAAAGVVAYARDGSGAPRSLAGRQALLGAGQAAVLAGLQGLDRWRSTGVPVHLDVSAQEAMIATGPTLQCTETTLNYKVLGGMHRFGAPSGWFDCSDGRVYIALHEDHQWEAIKRATQPPPPIAALHTADERIAHAEDIDRFMADWTGRRTKADVEARLQAEGVPATALNSLAELRDSPNFSYRARWSRDTVTGRAVTAMGSPYPVDEMGGVASERPRRLAELRVVEASHILAASLAGSVLGAMGAQVIKIEEGSRLDQYRRSGPFIDGKRDQEWSGYFSTANHSKRSYRFTDAAEVAGLIEDADVVVENWGHSRARRLGVDATTVHRRWPDKLGVSCSGFGHDGPLSRYRVYAANLNAFCGLLDSLGGGTGQTGNPGVSWVDYTCAYALATVTAAWAVGRPTGRVGAAVDIAMAEIVVQRLNEVLIAETEPARGAGAEVPRSRDYLFGTDDGEGCLAVTVDSDEDWRRLHVAVGIYRSTDEQQVREAMAVMNGAAVAERLAGLGVPAAVVLDAEQLTRDRHLAERGFFAPVTHPGWGRRHLVGLPWRFVGDGPIPLGPPPILGGANHAQPWSSQHASGQSHTSPREESAPCPTSATNAPAGSAG